MEAIKEDDAINAFYQEMSRRYPSVLLPLVHERDVDLAGSLKRPKAANGTRRVGGVTREKGHLRGAVHAIVTDRGTLRPRDLVGGRTGGSVF